MAFLTLNKEMASKVSEGGSYITSSGLYDVTLLAPIVSINEHGARSLNFYVKYNDQPQVLYTNMRLENNDGTPNFDLEKVQKLLAVAEVEDVADPIEATLPIGKNESDKDVLILEDLSEIDLKIWVKLEYSVYNGSIMEKKVIKEFYRADGASADEVINGTEPGNKLAKTEKYFDGVTYKDDLTAEAVAAWIADGRPRGTTAPKRKFGRS